MRSSFRPANRWLVALVVVVIAGLGLVALKKSPVAVPYVGQYANARLAAPAGSAWSSSAKFGSWNNGGFDVYNNEWNTTQAGPQLVWADSYHRWGVQSVQPDSTSVKTYPSVQQNYSNPALRRVKSLTSSFAQAMPAADLTYDAEAAYDLWLDNYKIEVMVWVANHGQTPLGGVINHVAVGGRKYAVYQGGPDMFSFVAGGKPATTGKVNLLSMLQWLIRHHYLSGSDSLTQVNFGWEIASTNGVPLHFAINDYALTTNV
jgi:Glycosyl hydrolase family 12